MIKWFLACVGLVLAFAGSPVATTQTPPPPARARPGNAPILPPGAELTMTPVQQHLHWTPTFSGTRINWEVDQQGSAHDAVVILQVGNGNIELEIYPERTVQIKIAPFGEISPGNALSDCQTRAVESPPLRWSLPPGHARSFCMRTDRGRFAYIVVTPHLCDGIARFDVDVTMWPNA